MNQYYSSLTLAEIVDEYCASAFNNERKYYENYMVHARAIWQEILKGTPFAIKHRLFKVDKTTRPHSVVLPKDIERFIGVSLKDHCGHYLNFVEDNSIAVVPVPDMCDSQCGCTSCGCSSNLCSRFGTVTVSQKTVVIDGVSYQETTHRLRDKSGAIQEVRRYPFLRYSSNKDYQLEWAVDEKVICQLDALPCGCIKDTISNRRSLLWAGFACDGINKYLIEQHNFCCTGKPAYKLEGKRVYLKGYGGATHVILSWQTDGDCPGEEILVPRMAKEALTFGIVWRAGALSSGNQRLSNRENRREYMMQREALDEFLNPVKVEDFMAHQWLTFWGGVGRRGCLFNVSTAIEDLSTTELAAILDTRLADVCAKAGDVDVPPGGGTTGGGTVLPPDGGTTPGPTLVLPEDMEWTVGVTDGAPVEDATTFTVPVVVPAGKTFYIRLFRNRDKQFVKLNEFTYDTATRLLTVTIPFQDGELIQVEFTQLADLEFLVGDAGAPVEGEFKFDIAPMQAGMFINLYRDRARQIAAADEFTYGSATKDLRVLFTPFMAGELISVERYEVAAYEFKIGETASGPLLGNTLFIGQGGRGWRRSINGAVVQSTGTTATKRIPFFGTGGGHRTVIPFISRTKNNFSRITGCVQGIPVGRRKHKASLNAGRKLMQCRGYAKEDFVVLLGLHGLAE